ncbi:MAG: xanthine dehydrogenase accessory protein XdhC, partial [Pseudomonadota bacterium]
VGRALAPMLAQLPLRVHWVDSRVSEFPSAIASPLIQHVTEEPLAIVTDAKPGSFFLVMTHEHPLDYALAEAILKRADFAYLGVIGSQSKSRRFRQRLAHRGFASELISQLRCPIGLAEVPGKKPAEIAVAVAAELVGVYQLLDQPRISSDTSWKGLQQKLLESDTQLDVVDTQKP